MSKVKSAAFAIAFGITALGLAVLPARAAVLLVDGGGQLTGAQNVDVLGTLYNVTFADGTCIAIFSGCDSAIADFTFTDFAGATAAAQALLDQVFIDDPLGLFDSNPTLTFGCSNADLGCSAHVPWTFNADLDVITVAAINTSTTDTTPLSGFAPAVDLSADNIVGSANVYAVFAVVPIPPAVLLFGSGLAALFGYAQFGRWRRRNA